MYRCELDHKEGWVLKNWYFEQLEKTLESPLDSKEIKPVNPKGNKSWIFIGRADAEVEAPILWLPDVKNWLIRKDPDTGKDWRQEEKGTTEDEMVGWHHQLDGYEFEQALAVGDRPGSLVCCSPRGHKQLDMTERLNWTDPQKLQHFVGIYLVQGLSAHRLREPSTDRASPQRLSASSAQQNPWWPSFSILYSLPTSFSLNRYGSSLCDLTLHVTKNSPPASLPPNPHSPLHTRVLHLKLIQMRVN